MYMVQPVQVDGNAHDYDNEHGRCFTELQIDTRTHLRQ